MPALRARAPTTDATPKSQIFFMAFVLSPTEIPQRDSPGALRFRFQCSLLVRPLSGPVAM
jgi:hypothetical protein